MSLSSSEVSQVSDSNRFLGMFALGAILMLALKLLFTANQLVVTVIPVAIMAYYFLQLTRAYHETNRPERAGDNIYYLGFLFTLVSLGLALYQFGTEGDKSPLISDFAIALSTTIAGVLGRVWLNQGDKELDEYERDAKIHVSDAIDDLKAELDRSKEAMQEFSTSTQQVLEENRDEQKKQLDLDRKTFEEHFTKSLNTMGEIMLTAVSEGSEKVRSELENLASGTAEQVEIFIGNVSSLNTNSLELSTSLNGAVKSLKKLPDIDEIISKKIEGFLNPLEIAISEIVKVIEQQAVWAESTLGSTREMSDSIKDVREEMTELSSTSKTSIQVFQDPMKDILDTLNEVKTTLSAVASNMADMNKAASLLKDIPAHVGTSSEQFNATISQFDDSTKQFIAKLDVLTESIESGQKTRLSSLQQDSRDLEILAKQRTKLSEALGKSTSSIESTATNLELQLSHVSNALIKTVQFLRDETKASD